MKAIAATKIWDELPPMDAVLNRSVTVLGSTGSIGVNTLDVIAHVRKIHGAHAMPITALTAGAAAPLRSGPEGRSPRAVNEVLLIDRKHLPGLDRNVASETDPP